MNVALSTLSVVDGEERQSILIFAEPLFRLRDPGSNTETMLDAATVAHEILSPLKHAQDAFLAIVDHVGDEATIGFVAHYREGRWSDMTAPASPRPLQWQDVVAEVWAGLQRIAVTVQPESGEVA